MGEDPEKRRSGREQKDRLNYRMCQGRVQLVNSVIITLHAVKSGFQSERIRGPRLPAFAAVWCTMVHRLPQRLGAIKWVGSLCATNATIEVGMEAVLHQR